MKFIILVTSWMRTGIEQGRREGEVSIVMRLLKRKVGELNPEIEAQVRELPESQLEALSEALLDFTSINVSYLYSYKCLATHRLYCLMRHGSRDKLRDTKNGGLRLG